MKATAALTTCLVLGLALSASAQPLDNTAGRKFPGYRPPTAHAYQRTAREHARVLSHYGKSYESVPKDTAHEHIAEVKRNVELAQREFAKLEPQAKQDPEVAKLLKSIHEHHAKALELCKTADAHGTEVAKLHECCEGMDKELQAAEVEHAKLLKLLKMDALAAPAQPAAVK